MKFEQGLVSVRIKILRTPDPREFAEFDVRGFRLGEIVDAAPQLATLLMIAGNAELVVGSGTRAEAADTSSARWPKSKSKPNETS